ncbi:hypothetical protein WR25_09349 [Diploscapter pachys]|uniref:CsbD-like domain-containing protein n=1 Tax=Diploscapter pachys TaxID=2018661 RepID=A0A2A2L5M8_9BILA|nr:hypothetical protein WR25_09349 [Diploscapter pachys]
MSDDRNVLQKAADKTKEMAGDAKDKVADTYHNIKGDNTTEDKAARQAKDTADNVKDKMGNARDNISDKMHEGGRKLQGY